MFGVCFQGVEKVAWREVEEPRLELPTDAIVEVELAGLCGSDLHPFFGREVGLDPGTVMGHEFVGRVLHTGSAIQHLRPGTRVFAPFSTNCGTCFYCQQGLTSRCQANQLFGWRSGGKGLHGGQAQRVRVPLADSTLVPLPEHLSAETGLLLGDNLSTGYFCAEMADIQPEGVTVLLGCGTVGLLALKSAKALGARKILAIDHVEERRQRAEHEGAVAMSPDGPVREWIADHTHGRGADSVMEVVGLPAAQRLAFELIRPGGTMSVIGCHTSPQFAFSPVDAYDKNLTFHTGRCPARYYMSYLAEIWDPKSTHIDELITHRFTPDNCVEAYRIFSGQRDGCIKAAFDFRPQ